MQNLRFILILSFLCLFLNNEISAQAPGFLGKKTSLTFSVLSSMAIISPTQNNYGGQTFGVPAGTVGLNYKYKLDFSFLVGRQASMTASVGQYYTGLVSEALTPNEFSGFFGIEEGDQHELFYRLNVKSVGIMFKRFKSEKGALAPMGRSFNFGLRRVFVSGQIVDKKTFFTGFSTNLFGVHQPLGINDKVAFHFAALSWSHTYVIQNRFLLNMGMELGLAVEPRYFFHYFSLNSHPDWNSQDNTDKYRIRAYERVFLHELFNIEIGVGMLLF